MAPVELSFSDHPALEGDGGSAPVVVLLHSLGSSRRMWAPQVESLSRRHRVIVPDLRGHGASPAPAGPYTMADLAGDVIALLDRLGVETAHIGGISMGGGIAQWLGAHAPERVSSLMLLSTAARFGRPQDMTSRAASARAAGTGALTKAVVGRWFTEELAAAEPAIPALFEEGVAATDDEGYAACCEALAGWDGRGDLAAIGARTVVVLADRDGSTPPDVVREVAEGIPGAELFEISPAAHLVNIEQADAVDEILLTHLAAVR